MCYNTSYNTSALKIAPNWTKVKDGGFFGFEQGRKHEKGCKSKSILGYLLSGAIDFSRDLIRPLHQLYLTQILKKQDVLYVFD